MTPTSHDLVCQGRGPHVTAWGSHGAAVVAWHGLARIGRGMDDIAAQLAQRWRVLSPDTLRRRLSRWSPGPGADSERLMPGGAEAMRSHGPRAVEVTIPGCGHAPALNTPAQFALVERFLPGWH